MSPNQSNWSVKPWDRGVEIYDHDRSITYKAMVDLTTGELDYLQVEVHDHIDENALRRVPVARIRRVTLEKVALSNRSKVFDRPNLGEVERLLREGRDRAWFIATYSDVPMRTVDGWLRRARALMKDPA